MIKRLLKGATAFSICAAAYVAWDVHRRTRSRYHCLSSLLNHYAVVQSVRSIGYFMHHKMEKDTVSCAAAQEETLLSLIKENANTEYGKTFKFSEIHSREGFVRLHPLTTYSDYAGYVDRVYNGEPNVMTTKQPEMIGVTSGTSGKPKLMPTTGKLFLTFFTQGVSVLYYLMYNNFPVMQQLQKDMKLFYSPNWRKSPGGLLVGPNSSTPKSSRNLLSLYTTPAGGHEITSEPEARYIHLLFGLADENLGMIEANFCSLVYAAFLDLRHKWPQLLEDLKSGRIDPKLKLKPSVRSELEQILRADPERADFIRAEIDKGLHGIAKRIWPKLGFVFCVTTGANEIYSSHLEVSELAGVPVYSPLYAATEGLIGMNIEPLSKTISYLLVPRAMFFEFIPLEAAHQQQPQTLFIDQVKEGEKYELVITNLSGFYRYRFGDVVKVVGFHNNCPKVEFLHRQGQLLNVRGEKTSEEILYKALMKAASGWGHFKVTDYCCVESVAFDTGGSSGEAPHYVVFVETESSAPVITEHHQAELDQALCDLSFVYSSFRNKGAIGSIKLHQVERGTFACLKEKILETSEVSANQFKVPRVIKLTQAIPLLQTKRVK